MRALIAGLAAITAASAQEPAQEPADYVVLAAFAESDPFDAAVVRLAQHRKAPVVRFDPTDLAPVRRVLAATTPRNVALVMRPEQIEFGFARRFLQLATELDDDPFVDFAFGYLTGRTAEDALALVERGIARVPKSVEPTVATVAGGTDRSFATTRQHRLRRQGFDGLQLYCAGDREFLAEQLPRLDGRDAVTFVGHGWPSEVVDGPKFTDLGGLRLDDAVALNVACYTGVTHIYFQGDYRAGVVRRREVPLDESFCLALLRTGVVGYTAYLCPRPAGPELDTDLAALLADGLSLGAARRRDYDKTVLGYLGFGEERMRLDAVTDGDPLGPNRDAVRDIMLEGATGGVLFGDPAVVPFVARPGESPVAIEVEEVEGDLRISAHASVRVLYLHCSDPTAKFGKTMAMKVYARIPLGGRLVEEVVVDDLRIGKSDLTSRVLWAIEDDHGERFLQLKVNFPRLEVMAGSLSMTARVLRAPRKRNQK